MLIRHYIDSVGWPVVVIMVICAWDSDMKFTYQRVSSIQFSSYPTSNFTYLG